MTFIVERELCLLLKCCMKGQKQKNNLTGSYQYKTLLSIEQSILHF
jgi:hypothetical protein